MEGMRRVGEVMERKKAVEAEKERVRRERRREKEREREEGKGKRGGWRLGFWR